MCCRNLLGPNMPFKQIGIGNFGGIVSSNVFRKQDAPRYLLGRELFLRYHRMSLY